MAAVLVLSAFAGKESPNSLSNLQRMPWWGWLGGFAGVSFKYPNAWAAIVIACILGIALYLVAVLVERLAMPWRRGEVTQGE